MARILSFRAPSREFQDRLRHVLPRASHELRRAAKDHEERARALSAESLKLYEEACATQREAERHLRLARQLDERAGEALEMELTGSLERKR